MSLSPFKSFLSSLTPTLNKPNLVSRPVKRTSLSFDRLEMRNLLATLTLDQGVLTINGTNDADVVSINDLGNGTFEVEDGGVITETYNNDDVDSVVFRGKNGNDRFTNATAIESTFYGHGGDDVFFGGSGIDTAYGGGDNDEIRGGGGDDFLNGSDGDDEIHGDAGEDRIFGGNGDDTIFGGDNDDFLSAEDGHDNLFGGNGDDFLRGYNGDDTLHGDAGQDLIYGQGGDDTIFGNDGNDRLRGNNDNDTIVGQLGHDVLIGDLGDDWFSGGEGNDIIYGFLGDDISYGDEGDDRIYDSDGNDQLYGGDGADILRAGDGNDTVWGGNGVDFIRGDAGNDRLYGGAQVDRLYGGDGDDSLHGGTGIEPDLIQGEAGSDRFHKDDADALQDLASEDVIIEYVSNISEAWSNTEIEAIDQGFQDLYDFAGSHVLLQETHSGTENVTIHKYDSLPAQLESRNIVNSETGMREIQFIDFNENSNNALTALRQQLVLQIAYSFNTSVELSAAFEDGQSSWQTFQSLSQWTRTDPQDSEFVQSGDGTWWYHQSAAFYDLEAQENPYEDFVSVWYGAITETFTSELDAKVNWLSNLVQPI